ncbi:MAG: hypothetical protein Q7T33_14810 [Dehalococcoidia bacterium]|nr:hypothetical protein [Dehalococcoidia bacterium]
MDTQRLEDDLSLLAAALVYPPAPSLTPAVLRRLAGPQPGQRPARPWAPALAAAALAFVLLASLLASISPTRDAVADLLDRINIFETEEPISGLPAEITGTPVSIEQAESALGWPLFLPAYPAPSQPERVLLQDFGSVRAAALFFRHPDGTPFVLFEVTGLVVKGLPRETATAEPVADLGREAYWIEGEHEVQYQDEQGGPIPGSRRRTAQHTLVWDLDGLVFRLEGVLEREEAVRIAQSLR